ncbi:hypothetical protein L1987_42470 [Smallanthus sonchifolius]|uniref:Uncharacterized protein n=1 Tax=Smallanthus sonchifolius TaxID=185202 RepID=A0ACB9GIV6_9ASTR|nr:hypothetical protein L1987_42470 [Smallanthus sonchifolius]
MSKKAGSSQNTRGKRKQVAIENAAENPNSRKDFQKMIMEGIKDSLPMIFTELEKRQADRLSPQLLILKSVHSKPLTQHTQTLTQSKPITPRPEGSSTLKTRKQEYYLKSSEDESMGNNFGHVENKRKIIGCTYNMFQDCKPYNFSRREGGIATLRWIEKTESVLAINKCAEKDKPHQNHCPKKLDGTGPKPEDGVNKNEQAFVLHTHEAAGMPDVITGTFLVNEFYARVLFDSGANQSFIDHRFCRLLNNTLAKLDKKYVVETTNDDLVQIYKVLNDCNITLSGHVIPAQLLPMTLAGFDIVLGMDWLASNQARILCDKKAIELRSPQGNIMTIHGDKLSNSVGIISMLKVIKYLRKGCLAYLVSVTTHTRKKIEDEPVVTKFSDVFPDELPGIPPEREVEFRINLVPGTAPIAKAPYRLAPTEMAKLKKHLEELFENGFIRPSSSPWELRSCSLIRKTVQCACALIIAS